MNWKTFSKLRRKNKTLGSHCPTKWNHRFCLKRWTKIFERFTKFATISSRKREFFKSFLKRRHEREFEKKKCFCEKVEAWKIIVQTGKQTADALTNLFRRKTPIGKLRTFELRNVSTQCDDIEQKQGYFFTTPLSKWKTWRKRHWLKSYAPDENMISSSQSTLVWDLMKEWIYRSQKLSKEKISCTSMISWIIDQLFWPFQHIAWNKKLRIGQTSTQG